MNKQAEYLEIEICEDLESWEEYEDRLLPPGWTAEMIATIEMMGKVVNLVTGEVEDEPVLLARHL